MPQQQLQSGENSFFTITWGIQLFVGDNDSIVITISQFIHKFYTYNIQEAFKETSVVFNKSQSTCKYLICNTK